MELVARLEKQQLEKKVSDAAMRKYRVSIVENDPARGVYLKDAVKDLDDACRKLDEFERGAK